MLSQPFYTQNTEASVSHHKALTKRNKFKFMAVTRNDPSRERYIIPSILFTFIANYIGSNSY